MALPEIIKDIEARVKDTGDEMTGALSVAIGDTITTLTSQSYGAILNTYKISNWDARRTLLINTVETHPDLTNALQLGYFENGAWKEQSILHTGNKSLIKPADIGAPTLTGEGASGTWPISITGQADSVYGRYTSNGGSQPPSYIGRNTVKFNMMRTFIDNKLDPGGYMDCMLMNTYSWSDVPYATAFGMLKTIGTPRAFIACGGNSNTTWSNATELLSVANYNEHVPSKTGAGASGTWPISISGNAASLSSTLQISKGGTGGTTAQEARTNLGLNSVKLDYTINLSSYSTSNYYLVDFGSGDLELDCEIHSPNVGGAEPYNQNVVHFLMIHQGWSDTPKSFTMLSQGCYTPTEITIMSIVAGNQNGLRGVYLRGGMIYRIRSNIAPNLNTTTKTYGNESYASGTSSFTTITNANTVWTNDGSQKSIFSIPLYGAVWNDYAEYRQTVKNIKPGMVVIEQGDGSMEPSTDRLQPGGNIVSDTFGFAIGETDACKTPLAVSGRALAYPAEDRYSYEPGDAVGTGPNGTVSKMTREEIMMYPERIIGTVSEIPEYEHWGTGNVLVDGRIWIKVK